MRLAKPLRVIPRARLGSKRFSLLLPVFLNGIQIEAPGFFEKNLACFKHLEPSLLVFKNQSRSRKGREACDACNLIQDQEGAFDLEVATERGNADQVVCLGIRSWFDMSADSRELAIPIFFEWNETTVSGEELSHLAGLELVPSLKAFSRLPFLECRWIPLKKEEEIYRLTCVSE